MIATVLLIAPAGFVMGIPFPTGLGLLERLHQPSVRWAWALNAAASVLGSVSALVLALYVGLTVTMQIGALLYLGALLVIVARRKIPGRVMTPASVRVAASAR